MAQVIPKRAAPAESQHPVVRADGDQLDRELSSQIAPHVRADSPHNELFSSHNVTEIRVALLILEEAACCLLAEQRKAWISEYVRTQKLGVGLQRRGGRLFLSLLKVNNAMIH